MLQLADLRLGSVGGAQPCVYLPGPGYAVQPSRDGGFLCALPADLHAEVLAEAEAPLPSGILGPAHLTSVPAIEEDEAGEEIPAGLDLPVMLLDLEVSALAFMRVFDPVTETGTVHSFVLDAPHLVPQPAALYQKARAWIEQETRGRSPGTSQGSPKGQEGHCDSALRAGFLLTSSSARTKWRRGVFCRQLRPPVSPSQSLLINNLFWGQRARASQFPRSPCWPALRRGQSLSIS